MLGGASQIVRRIRTKCNGTKTHLDERSLHRRRDAANALALPGSFKRDAVFLNGHAVAVAEHAQVEVAPHAALHARLEARHVQAQVYTPLRDVDALQLADVADAHRALHGDCAAPAAVGRARVADDVAAVSAVVARALQPVEGEVAQRAVRRVDVLLPDRSGIGAPRPPRLRLERLDRVDPLRWKTKNE